MRDGINCKLFGTGHYRGFATRTDRLVGMNCGCVLLSRNYMVGPPGQTMPTEYMFKCTPCNVLRAPPVDHAVIDSITATVYHYLETADNTGTYWQ